ncbi:hypothetical protein [Micromonospora sp. CPCC 205556]|uniref:hypothetical protein n=1 Tax=Micromonospora sp. CPCC 205556 TaxID=3122398 RepID=UPI002FF3095E
MAMVDMPAARRHHRSRISYAFGLLALVAAAVTLVVVIRYPAESTTRLTEPVPAPEITVVGEGSEDPDDDSDPTHPDDWSAAEPADGSGGDLAGDSGAVGGDSDRPADGSAGGEAVAGPATRGAAAGGTQSLSQSLFYSGLLGLAISLAGLGLVGTRRRRW